MDKLVHHLEVCEIAVETLADYVDCIETWLVGGATGKALRQCDYVMAVFHSFDEEAELVERGLRKSQVRGQSEYDAWALEIERKTYSDRMFEMARVRDHFRVCLIRLKHLGVCLD